MSRRFSPNKSKQCKLFEGMFKFQSECKWETMQYYLDLLFTSQSSEEFYTFLTNFKLLLDNIANRNPFVSIIIGDFNARSKNWCSSDKTLQSMSRLGVKNIYPAQIFPTLQHVRCSS